MQNETLKLVYPQWQGGDIAAFFKDLKPSEAARGYVLGAQILNLLVSNLNANLDKTQPLCLLAWIMRAIKAAKG